MNPVLLEGILELLVVCAFVGTVIAVFMYVVKVWWDRHRIDSLWARIKATLGSHEPPGAAHRNYGFGDQFGEHKRG